VGNCTKQNFFKGRNPNGQKTHEKMFTIPGHKGKIKTTLRFHPVRIAIIKNKHWQGCRGKRNRHILLLGMYTSTTTLENNMEAS
jgi:hypothetical protein